MNDKLGYIFDTETTGFNDPEVIQASGLLVNFDLEVLEEHDNFFYPNKEIEWGAVATHHILKEDLEGEPPSASYDFPSEPAYMIGHSIDFDWEVAKKPEIKRICTLALSRHMWPNTDSHKLGALIYMLYGTRYRDKLVNAHDSKIDVFLNLVLLDAMFVTWADQENPVRDWEDLWHRSEKARIPIYMPFGKHYGEPIAALPSGYKKWLLGLDDLDPYLRKAVGGLR